MPGTAQPNIGLLEGYTSGEDGWGADMNANLRKMDCLIQARVLDKDLTAPPASPTNGDAYIIAAAPTGAWSGQDTKIARWYATGGVWEFYTPRSGWRVYVVDEAIFYTFNGTVWA